MSDFSAGVAAMWPAFRDAGFLCVATDGGGDFDVDYQAPGQYRNDGRQISNEHEIEYQHADRPDLAQDDLLSIAPAPAGTTGNFRVRQAPYIRDTGGNASNGYFRCAVLTEVL